MGENKQVVEKLAKAWLAEARRLRSRTICDCGCDKIFTNAGARFQSGHDAKLLRKYRDQIREILESG